MVNLQELPTELLSRILSFITEPACDTFKPDHQCSGTEVLYNLCLVSQVFRDVAQPLLFRSFDGDGIDANLRELLLFTRSVYRRPDLGNHVKFITVDPNPFPSAASRELVLNDLALFLGVIRELQLGNEEQKTWEDALKKFDLSLFLALLTYKTPNLRALRIPHGQVFPRPFTTIRDRDPSYLSGLEQIWITCDDLYGGYPVGYFNEFLTLPKMTAPTFEYGDLVEKSPHSTWAPGTLAAEELAFRHCHIDAAGLNKFMKACRKVKSFTYQNFHLDPSEMRTKSLSNTAEFNAAEIHAAILPHKDTLEHFHLEYYREPWMIESIEAYQEYCSTRVKIPSFREFPVLETIIIQHALLPSHPRFPRSLQTLDITDCNSSIREMVANIAKDCKDGLYPQLTEFKVIAIDVTRPIKLPGQRVPQGQTPAQCFMSLQELFKGTKVEFQICPYSMPDDDDVDDDGDDDDVNSFGPFPGGPRGGLLFQMIMQQAMRDPDIAAMLRQEEDDESDRSWVTEEEDEDDN